MVTNKYKKISNYKYSTNYSPIVNNMSNFTTAPISTTFLGSGCMSAQFFEQMGSMENTETSENDVLAKQALVAVEGSYKDSNGKEHTFTPERLQTIASYTNKALEQGIVVPLCTDHKKEFNSTVGSLEGNLYVKSITENDLPNKKAKHLIGKQGLFAQDVHVKDKDAAEKVKSGVVTSVSMGLNLDPKDHRLVELSLVPIPAIPNMGLFGVISDLNKMSNFALTPGATNTMDEDKNIFTWEDLETNEQTLDDLRDEYDDLTEKLWNILNNIYTSESADITDVITLKQYVYAALNGFSIRVVDILGLSSVPDSPMPQAGQVDQQAMNDIQAQDVNNMGMAPMGLGIGKAMAFFKGNKTVDFSSGLLPYAKFSRFSKYQKGL